MSTIVTSYKNASALAGHGLPAFETLDTYIDANLLAGGDEIPKSVRILAADSLTLAQFTVVGLVAGKITPAVWNATVASGVKPIGVLAHGMTSGVSNTTIYAEVFLEGEYNAGSDNAGTDSPLVWDASFDTLAKKTTWEGLVGNPALLFRSRLGGNPT